MKGVSILGATGSIGRNALEVVRGFPDRLRVVALSAGDNVELLAEQVARFRPAVVSVASPAGAEALARLVDLRGIRCRHGESGMTEVAVAEGAEIVVAAAVGAVGLTPTYRALQAGRDVALANKEAMVIAGELMTQEAKARGARILPIDSEHCALHQCLDGRDPSSVARLWLTASGGPFRTRDPRTFDRITVEEALAHPTWRMGRKITIDSATLMNKALEIIEARHLFDVPGERVDVVVHPQSVVHSIAQFKDGTMLAQLGRTDMRIPIQYALTHPDVLDSPLEPMDLKEAFLLQFEPPNHDAFPSLGLAKQALARGGTAPAAMNAANEVAVQAFLDGRIRFPAITDAVGHAIAVDSASEATSLGDVLAADARARDRARTFLGLRN
jgi:1-deoxy-D-xylulose-5-phosphate reductoisomerase